MLNIIKNDLNHININLTDLKDKSILITGASGLIGIYLVSYICKYQKNLNIKIYIWSKNNIDPIFLPLFENCEKIIGDIVDHNIYTKLPKFDFIIHAAGYGQPGKFLEDKIKTIEINTLGTKYLLNQLKNNGKFLFISSSEIYNGNELFNITENEIGKTNTDHPRACYIEGKRMGETICNIYKSMGNDIKIARLSLAYGPGTKKGDARVLNSLIEKSIKNDYLTLLDKGDAIRTYCYITDVVEMFLNILLNGNGLYNVGGISKLSIFELANKISSSFSKKVITPEIEESLSGSPKIVNISIEKYLNEFNKKSFISFDEGLKNTIEWQKKLYNYV
jgi:nucleoside-diphosphate-sugar epimerase